MMWPSGTCDTTWTITWSWDVWGGWSEKELTDYLRKALHFLLRPLRRYLMSASDKLFSALKNHILNHLLRDQMRQSWIFDETWESIDARVTARQEGAQQTVRKINWRICTGLSTNRKRHAEDSGRTIKSLILSYPPPCKRGMGPDAGEVHRCGRQTPTPSTHIPGYPDSRTCGDIRPLPAARATYSHRGVPLTSVW